MQQYEHRNGETEPPTERGYYFFDGLQLEIGNMGHPLERGLFGIHDPNGKVECVTDGFTGDYGEYNDRVVEVIPVQEMRGRWWGPVTPPWMDA